MKNLAVLVSLFIHLYTYGQKATVTFLDESSKKPIVGLQIFSENGSCIGNTNATGKFDLDIHLLQQGGIKSVLAYNADYFSLEYNLNEVPSFIYLKKNEAIQLNDVVVKAHGLNDYYTLKGFFRSWQLVNGKLVKYGDGLVEYHMPYATIENDFDTGVKNFFTNYRTFRIDSIKQKSRIIRISSLDEYLSVSFLPKNDMLKRGKNYLKVEHIKNNLGDLYDEGKKVGYVIYDENNIPAEISETRSFEGDEAIKILFWKFSGKSKQIERWTGSGNTRRPAYTFYSDKKMIKTNVKGKFNSVETVTEIFITDEIITDNKIPEKYKSFIDKDRSFYRSNYWDDQLVNHPLPSEIKSQLININENKNTY
ncbi:hypothetical protein [Flavobacterium gillisiae]|nr:hypothetical protein [Flavobacterium gillisiae]